MPKAASKKRKAASAAKSATEVDVNGAATDANPLGTGAIHAMSIAAERDAYKSQLAISNRQHEEYKKGEAARVAAAVKAALSLDAAAKARAIGKPEHDLVSPTPNLPSGKPSSLPSSSVTKTRSKQKFSLFSHKLLLHARLVFNVALAIPTSVLQDDPILTNLRCKILSGIHPVETDFGIFKPFPEASMIPEELRTSCLSMDLYHALSKYFRSPTPSTQIASLDRELLQSEFEFVSEMFSSIHQVPVGRGTVDVLLSYDLLFAASANSSSNLKIPRQLLSLVSVEFTRTEIDEKFNQAYAYATHTLDLINYSVPILSIRMSKSEFSVDVFYLEFKPTKRDHQFICISLVPTQTITDQSLHALLTLIVFWFRTFEPIHKQLQTQGYRLNFKPHSNVVEFEGFIYKRINTKNGKSFDLNAKFIPGVELLFSDNYVRYVRYPKIEGTHNPTSLLHLKSLIDEVIKLHQNKPSIVHGDIRFANVIFSAVTPRASLIDFDMSGQAGKTVYPMNFVFEISPDGERHPDALHMKPLQIAHDCFAVLALLLKLVDCVPQAIRDEYRTAVSIKTYDDKSLQRVGLTLEVLHRRDATDLMVLSSRAAADSGTGSLADTAKHHGSPGTEAAIASAKANAAAAALSSRKKRSSSAAFGGLLPTKDKEQFSGSGSDKTSNSVSSMATTRASLKSRKSNQSIASVPLPPPASRSQSRAKIGFTGSK